MINPVGPSEAIGNNRYECLIPASIDYAREIEMTFLRASQE